MGRDALSVHHLGWNAQVQDGVPAHMPCYGVGCSCMGMLAHIMDRMLGEQWVPSGAAGGSLC